MTRDEQEIEFGKILVATCDSQALSVIRQCRDSGIATVAVFAADDADAECVREADESVCIGASCEGGCYGDAYAILSAAELKSANAIHLCGGPLSGDDDFVNLADAAGFTVLDSVEEGE